MRVKSLTPAGAAVAVLGVGAATPAFAARTGFGGSQESNVSLTAMGVSPLLAGGARLLVRRRARS